MKALVHRPKKKVQCAHCPRKVWRYRADMDASCTPCRKQHRARWHAVNRAARTEKMAAWYRAHAKAHQAAVAEWRKNHPEDVRRYSREWWREERRLTRETLADLPCLECGMKHTEERRLSILGRMLPTSAHEIRDAWSCIWGLPGEQDAGARRLYRDLEKLGTVRDGGAFYLQSARAA